MGRAPCCEKLGLKKGPWTPEEDRILISYIEKYGHPNWRALPKLAGLLRCGKSCRLRWTNYLRPDIKRGNFTKEEEDTIIQLHQILGNRWSTIAAKLPGRTDNEIKNVWHTHLKKRLKPYQPSKSRTNQKPKSNFLTSTTESHPVAEAALNPPTSPQQSSSDLSSVTEASALAISNSVSTETKHSHTNVVATKNEQMESSMQSFPVEIDKGFWGADDDHIDMASIFQQEFLVSPFYGYDGSSNGNYGDGGMDFWYNIFIGAGGSPELPEF
ncbi:hypothetical protein Ancab_030192 [Ancistrocladus abbreviatus]